MFISTKKALCLLFPKKYNTLKISTVQLCLLRKSPFLYVNGTSIQYSFHVSTGATRHSLNLISDSNWNWTVSDMSVICSNSYLCELIWDYCMQNKILLMYGTVQKSYLFVHVLTVSIETVKQYNYSHFVSVMSMRKKSNTMKPL